MNIKRIVVGFAATFTIVLALTFAPTMNATASAPATVETDSAEICQASPCEDWCDLEFRDCLENGGSLSTCQADWIDCMWSCQ